MPEMAARMRRATVFLHFQHATACAHHVQSPLGKRIFWNLREFNSNVARWGAIKWETMCDVQSSIRRQVSRRRQMHRFLMRCQKGVRVREATSDLCVVLLAEADR
jgi:hypothetical protein